MQPPVLMMNCCYSDSLLVWWQGHAMRPRQSTDEQHNEIDRFQCCRGKGSNLERRFSELSEER